MKAIAASGAEAPTSGAVPEGRARGCAETRVVTRLIDRVPDDVAADWQSLANDAAEANCFAEPWFVDAGLRSFADGGAVRLVEIWSGSSLIGCVPLALGSRYARGPVRHVLNWSHYNAFLGSPLVRAGREADFWTALLGHLDWAEWAPGFLHFNGLVEGGAMHRGLVTAAATLGRSCPTVHRMVRAQLSSGLSPDAYYETNVRKKKRKELKRLANRLAELGEVSFRRLGAADELSSWVDTFLALEHSGWKGRAGTALACDAATEGFFRAALEGAHKAGRLEIISMDLDARPIAMLVNFLTPPGSFSFKIAFDEDYARFSPGVLIQIENLRLLERGDIAWMDSCAVEDHPMIDSLWAERRAIVRVTVRLAGVRRGIVYGACRALERGSTMVRKLAAVQERRA